MLVPLKRPTLPFAIFIIVNDLNDDIFKLFDNIPYHIGSFVFAVTNQWLVYLIKSSRTIMNEIHHRSVIETVFDACKIRFSSILQNLGNFCVPRHSLDFPIAIYKTIFFINMSC